MDSSERILVLILSGALAVFLVLGIIALIKVIQILHNIKRVTARAAKLADKAEAVGDFLERAATPLVVSKMLSRIADGLFKKRRKGRRRGEDE